MDFVERYKNRIAIIVGLLLAVGVFKIYQANKQRTEQRRQERAKKRKERRELRVARRKARAERKRIRRMERRSLSPFRKICWSSFRQKVHCKVHSIKLVRLQKVPSDIFTCNSDPSRSYSTCEAYRPFREKHCIYTHNTLSCYSGLMCGTSGCEYTVACQMKRVGVLRKRHLICFALDKSTTSQSILDLLQVLKQKLKERSK